MPADRLTNADLAALEAGKILGPDARSLAITKLDAIVEEVRASRELLAELEWSASLCGSCGNHWQHGHAPGCRLAALLGRAP